MGIFSIFRPAPTPTGTDLSRIVGDGKLRPIRPEPSQIRPLEASVIDIASSLVSLTKIETDIRALKQPDRTMSRRSWLRQLTWHALIDGVFAIVVIKYAGEDDQYLIFPDSLKPTKVGKTRYQYSRNDEYFEADERDILQFRYRFQDTKNVYKLREAEDSFWDRYCKVGSNVGFLYDEALKEGYTGRQSKEVSDEVDSLFMQNMAKSNVARLQGAQRFAELNKGSEPLEPAFSTIVRAWCYNYKLPTSLINLDLPSHSTVTVGASYGHFIRQCVKPLLEDVMEALSIRNDKGIVLNYRDIERGSLLENAEGLMKLSQTGVMTINEIRDVDGYPPREDGDDYPKVAGAPDKVDQNAERGSGTN